MDRGLGLDGLMEKDVAEVGSHEEAQLAKHHQDSGDDHHEEPNPDDQVNLLVDDVDGKITNS